MKNYTANEMQELQRQAIERVRDMQKRSQIPGRNAANEPEPQNPRQERGGPNNRSSRQSRPGEAEKKPAEIPERTHAPESLPGRNPNDADKFNFLPHMDSDKALLLALVLLLSNEGADTELILALLYIMY